MSATPDSTLADPKQRIADLQRQLAERTAERDEALAREAATAEILAVINSSPGDLTPVFEAILEKATRICEAMFAVLLTWDGERLHRVAFRGLPTELVEALREPMKPVPGTIADRIVRGEKVIATADLREAEYTLGGPGAQAFLRHGARSCVHVALHKEERLLGSITVYREEVLPFTDKQIALLQSFAAQAVIAMENARLLTETREALEQQTATAEVLQVINSSPGDLAPVFDAILEKAHALCGATRGALVTNDDDWFRAIATRGMPERFAEHLRLGFPLMPGPGAEQLLRGEHVHILDLPAAAADSPPELARLQLQAAELAGTRTIVMVPLCKDGRLLGYIAGYRTEVRPFTEKQIALVENFAAQAVIAMENARLLTETREALEQQTATAEVLQVINSSPGDLAPVFDAMLEKAMRLCGAAFGALWTYDGEYMHSVATRGVPQQMVEFLKQGPHRPASVVQRTIIDGAPYEHITDLRLTEGYRINEPIPRAGADLGGVRTLLGVSLRKDDKLIGILAIFRQEVSPFSDKQIALLQNFAAQAVIAMENARLITETREALEQQTATAEVLGVINSSPGDLAPVFDAILEKAHTLCGAVTGVLTVRDGEEFRLAAVHGELPFVEAWREAGPVRPPDGWAVQLARGEVVHLDDALSASVYRNDPQRRRMLKLSGARTLLFVPLRREEKWLGTITAGRREVRPFTDKQIALLQNFAAQAVIAMENARLLGELHQRTDEVAELNRGLEARVAEQVEELGRVGRLKRFLAPQLAELIVSQGDEKILESHRREIVVVFCDLRGYTAFTETAEPEEVLDFLREYHGALGPLVSQFEGTLDQFSGDGIMVFFNDPVPCPDPAERAVNMAVAMREAAGTLITDWRERGRDLGFGAGIAQGYATLGQIGFSERSGYTAIGTVCNVAARLCAEAKDGQILLSQRVNVALKGSVATEQVGALALKGLTQPVVAYNVPLAPIQPGLRVIEGGPQSV